MKKSFLVLFLVPFIFACGSKKQNSDAVVLSNKQAIIDSMKQVAVIKEQQREIDSLKMLKTSVATKEKSGSANGYTSSGSSSVPTSPVSYASTKKKKKMGNVAKGAIIGAGVGAVTGAIVSKKKGKGAIVGGVVGAGAGAGVGAVINQQQKKKQKDTQIYF